MTHLQGGRQMLEREYERKMRAMTEEMESVRTQNSIIKTELADVESQVS